MTRLLFLFSLLLTLGSCSKPQEQEPVQTLSIRVVHSPETRAYLGAMRDSFVASKPRLSDGTEVSLELINEMAFTAAQYISSGSLKTEGWLAPSSAHVDYANTHLKNLGPAQINCKHLFASPLVFVTHPKHMKRLNANGHSFSLDSLLAQVRDDPNTESNFSFAHAAPGESTTGLSVLVQLAYFANADHSKPPLAQDFTDPKGLDVLKRFEQLVANYDLSESALLSHVQNSSFGRPQLVITSEQQLILYNQQSSHGRPALTALYPSEGSYWDDYTMCLSDAAWVTPAQRAAYNMWVTYLSGEHAQTEAKRSGFRPSIVTNREVNTFSEAFGVTLQEPQRSLLPVSGNLLEVLRDKWPTLMRKSAIAFVVDTSGSMEGEALVAAQNIVRGVTEKTPPGDMRALLSFSTEPSLLVPFTDQPSTLLSPLAALQGIGGSAIYDSLQLAYKTIRDKSLKPFRKIVLLITDGGDKNSNISLITLTDFIKDQATNDEIELVIVGVVQPNTNFADLEQFAANIGARFRKDVPANMGVIAQDLVKNLSSGL